MTNAMKIFDDLEYGLYDKSFENLKSICDGPDPEKFLDEILEKLSKIEKKNKPAEEKFLTFMDLALIARVSRLVSQPSQVWNTLIRYRKSLAQPRKEMQGLQHPDQRQYRVVKACWPETPSWAFDALRVFGDKDIVFDKTMTWAVLIDEEDSPARLEVETVRGYESHPIVFKASESMSFVTVDRDTQMSLENGLNYALSYLDITLPIGIDFRWRLRRLGKGIEKISGESISGAFCLCCVRLLQQYEKHRPTAA